MNTIRYFFLPVCFLILFLPGVSAQGWERVYAGLSVDSEVKRILPAADSGFLALASRAGDWGSDDNRLNLLKLSPDGAIEWTRDYDLGAFEHEPDMIATSDGGYLLLCKVFAPGGKTSTVFAKLDAQFNLVFTRDLGLLDPDYSVSGYRLFENSAGYWIIGNKSAPGSITGIIARFDTAGNFLSYGDWGLPADMYIKDITATPDGGFIVAGHGKEHANDNYAKIAVARYDASGTLPLWYKSFGGQGDSQTIEDIAPAPDGGYVLATYHSTEGVLVHVDEQGDVLWQKSFPYHPDSLNNQGIARIVPTAAADGYWAVSMTGYYVYQPQIALLRLDLAGNTLWAGLFGPKQINNFVYALAGLADGGCIFGGSTSRPDGGLRPYVIRVDAIGRTFLSGISGDISLDLDADCLPDADTAGAKFQLVAWKNGVFAGMTTSDAAGKYALALDTGQYRITLRTPAPPYSFCPDTIPVTVAPQDTVEQVDFNSFINQDSSVHLSGYVFEDYDGDCMKDPFEPGYPGWAITAIVVGFPNFTVSGNAVTNDTGYFEITGLAGILQPAQGFFSIAPPAGDGLNCTVTCPQAFQIAFDSTNSYVAGFGVHCDSLPPCPVMDVDIATAVLRPCQAAAYAVQYCNNGSVTAGSASVVVSMDPALTVTGSSIPWASVSGSDYTFDLGDLAPEACGSFSVFVTVPCTDPVGVAYCVQAHAYPDTLCQMPGPNWDGSRIEATSACTGDSVFFTIRNTGDFPMAQALDYIVIEDNVMLNQAQGQFQLDPGAELAVRLPATGAFYRLEAGQSPGLTGISDPVAWVEGCGGANASLGFVNQYFLPDDEPWLDIFCIESVNSFDPNDKNGFPRGYDSEHFIPQNSDIEYLLRFQNTGTAPALDVELRDTIPLQRLDPLSVRAGASSHPYTWDMQGDGVVVFRFPGINLPDSVASPEGSRGFVKFRISQRPDLPSGTKIENTAAIYFDHNAPVITNKTLHTVGEHFVPTPTRQPAPPALRVRIAPNPVDRWVSVTVDGKGQPAADGLQFRLNNQLGERLLSIPVKAHSCRFDAGELPAGVYFYELLREGWQVIAAGKLIKL